MTLLLLLPIRVKPPRIIIVSILLFHACNMSAPAMCPPVQFPARVLRALPLPCRTHSSAPLLLLTHCCNVRTPFWLHLRPHAHPSTTLPEVLHFQRFFQPSAIVLLRPLGRLPCDVSQVTVLSSSTVHLLAKRPQQYNKRRLDVLHLEQLAPHSPPLPPTTFVGEAHAVFPTGELHYACPQQTHLSHNRNQADAVNARCLQDIHWVLWHQHCGCLYRHACIAITMLCMFGVHIYTWRVFLSKIYTAQ